MTPDNKRTLTLEEVCKRGLIDYYHPAELIGKPLIDLFPKMRISKGTRKTGDMEILERWCADYRAKGIPFVVGWLDEEKQYARLCKEQLADPYEAQTKTRRRTKGLSEKDWAVINVHDGKRGK